MEQILTSGQHFWFVVFTSYIAIAGGLLLWMGFIIWSLIIRKFEKAYAVKTYWQIYLLAPAGLVIYLYMQALASLRNRNLDVPEQLAGFALLSVSALLCMWAVWRFRTILNLLVEERR